MPHVLPRRRPSPMAAAATLTRLCGPWHTALPTTAQVGSQRSQLLRRRRGDAVREGCDASRRVALAHSRDLRACLQGEDGRNKLEAWGLLRLLVETEEVNEYHFSLVLQDGCDNVEAVRRLDGLIEESGVKPNHVLSTGLHAAWVEHGEFERAVQVLAVARRDGQLRSRVITGISLTTLSRMVQEWPHGGLPERACSLDADITAVTTPWDYLRELYTAGLAQPAHVAAVLRLCTSADTIDLLLREMRAHGLAPDVHFYTALHNAWLSVGEMADAVHAIEEAREALSHDPASEGLLSRTRSNALRDMLAVEGEQGRQRAWAYFYELQLRGIADIFQYGVMAELGCDSRQELFDLFHRKTLIPHAATYTTLHHVWVRLGDMEEAVHQLRQGLVQGVLSRNAVDGLLSATITALSIPCAADGTRSVGAHTERRRERQRQRPKKAEMAWGWRVRPALENDEATAASVGHTAGSLSVSDPAKDAEAQETPIDRAWEYFTAAQRAARGGGMSENLLGSSHYKLMAGLCRTADELRSLQAAYALHIIAGDANARAFSASSHRLKGSYSTDNASLSCHSSHSDSVKGLWFGAGAINDDLSFAKSVHTAWMNQFGDPAAAVAALESVLESFRSQGFAATTPGAAAAANTSIEMMAETETGVPTDGFCAAATADRSPSTYSKLVERIARYNSSTLLRLLEQRAGVATKAGRAEASNYLQILRRHGLADVYHYTIVLHSCCKTGEVDAILAAMAADGVEHTPATQRTLATLRRRLSD